ncbi:MAG: hypothetical protein JOZ69_19955 [Myxococcales bacterium]|nr:hypothetical protein [Myxococcales bacterium]
MDGGDDQTRTLRGLGPLNMTACPACHASREKPPIDVDIAVAFGVALVLVRGARATRAALCRRHASLADLLANEFTSQGRSTRRR